MTLYHSVGREIEVIGADLSGDSNWTVWWAYAASEFDDLTDEHSGVHSDPISQLTADGGVMEVFQAIADLPENRVVAQHKAVAKLEDSEE